MAGEVENVSRSKERRHWEGPVSGGHNRPRLDLFNFDAPEHQTSRYILTSPRSLQACARLSIKPVELLPRSLAEFTADSAGLGLREDTLRAVYQEDERQRKAKLQAARREREKLIAELPSSHHSHGNHSHGNHSHGNHSHGNHSHSNHSHGNHSHGNHSTGIRDRHKQNSEIPPKHSVVQAWMTGDGTARKNQPHVSFEDQSQTNAGLSASRSTGEGLKGNKLESCLRERGSGSRTHHTTHVPVTTLPEKDQRILGTLSLRLAEEVRVAEVRRIAALQWDLERQWGERERREREEERQRRLTRAQRNFERQLCELQQVRHSLEEEEAVERLASLHARWARWEEGAQLQATARSQRREEKRYRDHQRKVQQELKCHELEMEEALQRQAAGEHLNHLVAKATTNRETIAHGEAMKRHLKLEAEKSRYEKRKAEVEALNMEDQELLKASVDQRHVLARERHLSLLAQKEEQIRQTGDARRQRAVQRKLAADRIETELEEWRREVEEYNRMCMARADDTVQRLMDKRSQKVQSRRTEREREHAENLRRVVWECEEWRQQVASEVEMKNERSQAILRDRETSIQKSREVAHTSSRLRQQVKDHYLRNSFDRMVLEAEMYASLGRAPPTAAKNISKVILG